jgi:hypothetical protein
LLRDTSSNEIHRLSSGDDLQGWELKIVDARSIELRSGDRVQGLTMFQSFGPQASAEPSGEPYNENAPPDAQQRQPPQTDEALPPAIDAPAQSDESQSPDGYDAQQPQDSASPDAQNTSPDPDSPEAPPANFDPQVGGSPIPDEGALPMEPDSNINH